MCVCLGEGESTATGDDHPSVGPLIKKVLQNVLLKISFLLVFNVHAL